MKMTYFASKKAKQAGAGDVVVCEGVGAWGGDDV